MLIVSMAAAGLAALTLGLAPRLLATRAWALRHPQAALRCWIASLIVLTSAVLIAAVAGASGLVSIAAGHVHPAHLLIPVAVCLLMSAAAAVWIRLKQRRAHRLHCVHAAVSALEPRILSREDRGPFELVRIADALPLSYAVAEASGTRAGAAGRPLVMVSTGMVELLSPAQLQTIIAHEHAHVRLGHEALIRAAQMTEAVVPAGLSYGQAFHRAVTLLVELSADDAAARRAGAVHLANALARVAVATGDASLELRAERLTLKPWPPAHRIEVPAAFRAA